MSDKLKNVWKQFKSGAEEHLIFPWQKEKIREIKMRMDRDVSGAEAATTKYKSLKAYSDRKIKKK
jgi:hypothetical protein|tara:strand:- start:1565 stop:1759 length:195 start_codon:yes stop_codon:yes gene_type:complete